jgi:hypothetical protein
MKKLCLVLVVLLNMASTSPDTTGLTHPESVAIGKKTVSNSKVENATITISLTSDSSVCNAMYLITPCKAGKR